MKNPILWPAKAHEIEELRAIEKAARSRYRALPDFAFAAEGAAIGAERFSAGVTIVAEVAGRPIGFALTHPLDNLLYLANISVAPQSAGRGIGMELLDAAAEIARQYGAPALTLTTFKAPPWNGPWFRKKGFVAMPEGRIGTGLRAILDRHATFLDKRTRETLWKVVA